MTAIRSTSSAGVQSLHAKRGASWPPALLVLLGFLALACRTEGPPVEETVQRLAEASRPRDRAPKRCAVDDEFRPALGCPEVLLLATKVAGFDPVELVARVPRKQRGRSVFLIPALDTGRYRTWVAQSETASTTLGEEIKLSIQQPTGKLLADAAAQIRAYPLPEPEQAFSTEPATVPRGGLFSVGLAVASVPGGTPMQPVSFHVEAHGAHGTTTLLQETVEPSDALKWHDRLVSLRELEGHEVTFRLLTRTQSGPAAAPSYPLWGAPEILAPKPRDGRRNLVLISLDTVRADHLGAEVGGRRLTPFFDRLAEQGTRFRHAIAPYSSTTASHMSLFSGQYPVSHGVRGPADQAAPDLSTLPQLLATAGYATGAVTENAMLLAGSGFARGFDVYRENREALDERPGWIDHTFASGVEWIEHNRNRLFFLFLHSYEAHAPFVPSPEALEAVGPLDETNLSRKAIRRERLKRRYAAEVHYTDRAVANLFAALKRLDLLDKTLVVITSDHGEEFGEHGQWGHSKSVYDETLRVPLLFWAPGDVRAGQNHDGVVSLVDVLPTILELLDLPAPSDISGHSLAPATRGGSLPAQSTRFAETLLPDRSMIAARTNDHKWIWQSEEPSLQVYDLRTDPGETTPLDDPELLNRGRELIDGYRNRKHGGPSSPASELDGKTQRRLRALGYVE